VEPDKKRFLDDPANVARLWRGFVIACAAVAALDLLGLLGIVWHRHVSLFVEGLPGFYPIWGFLGISILIVLAKRLRAIVMRPEDYYDDGE
jgi:hypothetical protein